MTNVGVVGVGAMGINHARIYSEMPTNLVGISDTSEKVGKQVAKRFNTDYMSNDELAKKADAVSIAVPTKNHFEIASYFLEREINVLVEKPISTTLDEASKLIALAEKNNCTFQVGHIERFNPTIIEMKKRVKEPFYIEACRVGNVTRITDSGVVLDLMIHDIDLVLDLIPSKPVSLAGYLKQGKTHEDLASVSICFENGEIAHLIASRLTARRQRTLSVHTPSVCYCADLMNRQLDIYTQTTLKYLPNTVSYSDVIERPRLITTEPLRLELESFISCVKTGTKPIVDGEAGKAALKLALDILKLK